MQERCPANGKVRHVTAGAAWCQLRHTRKTQRRGKIHVQSTGHVYRCHVCHGFHITSLSRRQSEKVERWRKEREKSKEINE